MTKRAGDRDWGLLEQGGTQEGVQPSGEGPKGGGASHAAYCMCMIYFLGYRRLDLWIDLKPAICKDVLLAWMAD